MAVTFTTTAQAGVEQGMKCIIYGESGNGKTTLGGTAPEGKTLFISAEKRFLSIRNKNHHAVTVDTYEDLLGIYTSLATDPSWAGIEWTVLDSFSEIGENFLKVALTKTKDPRQAYGELRDKMVDIAKKFRDLQKRNVVFICKADTIKDDVSGMTMQCPAMPGQALAKDLPYLFDEVWYLAVVDRVVEGRTVQDRWIQTNRDMRRIAKDSSGSLDFYEPADLMHIHNKILSTLPKGN